MLKSVLYFGRKDCVYSNKIREHLKKNSEGKPFLIYKKDLENSGLIETYGKNLIEAIRKRDQILIESFKYMQEKTKGLNF